MLLRRKAAIILATLAIVLFNSVMGYKTVSLNHHLNVGEFVQDSRFLTNPGQVYGSCYQMQKYKNKFQAQCTLGFETIKSIASSDHQRFCHFVLHFNSDIDEDEYHARTVVAIDKNKAVLTMESINSNKFFILHFSDCRVVPVKMDIEPRKALIAAPFDDLFDIIVTDAGNFCSVNAPCKTVVDTEGNIISKTKQWSDELAKYITMIHSPTLGRIVVDEYGSTSRKPVARIYTVDDNGSVEHLWKKPLHRAYQTINYDRLIVSTTNNLLSVCSAFDAALTCGQFDLEGKKKFELSLPIHRYLDVRSLNIHNLPNGGFLLISSECLRKDSTICVDSKDTFIVYKIDATGGKFGEFKISKPSRVDPRLLHFFENEEDGMCLSYVNQEDEKSVLDVICFRNKDFS